MKFLDVRTDFAFKKVFGSKDSTPRLISFLNSVIHFYGDNTITDLDIVNPYNIPQLQGMKDTFVDVKAVLSDKTTVIIEMQVLNHQGFENRVLFNTAKNYSQQLIKGEDYHLLKPVIALTIVDFEMFAESPDMINNFKVMNKKDFSHYSNDIELIFIELNKFNKPLEACQNDQDNWLYFLKNAGDLSVIPKDLPSLITTAYEVSNEAGMSKEELELQYKKKEFIAVQRSAITHATEQGIEQGKAEGIEQGKVEGIEQGQIKEKKEVAKTMKNKGLEVLLISEITGLNESDIELL